MSIATKSPGCLPRHPCAADIHKLNVKVGDAACRSDEGFKKTNDTFVRVMERLATIDKAQEKIDGLTSNVVSLQALLGDKKSRGAFDFVYKDEKPLLVEMSYGYRKEGYYDCEGYWDSNLNWYPGAFNPYEWIIENLKEAFLNQNQNT